MVICKKIFRIAGPFFCFSGLVERNLPSLCHISLVLFARSFLQEKMEGQPGGRETTENEESDHPVDSYVEQLYDELVRDAEPWRVLHVSTLGLLLFSSPSVIMAFVNRWLTHDIFNHALDMSVNESESLGKLMRCIVTDHTDIQVELRSARYAASGKGTIEASIAFLHSDDNNISAFACSKEAIVSSLESENRAMQSSDNKRFLPTLFSSILTATVATGRVGSLDGKFLKAETNFSHTRVQYKALPLSPLAGLYRDNSAFIIAVGIHLVSQYDQVLEAQRSHEENRTVGPDDTRERRAQMHFKSLRESCIRLLETYSRTLSEFADKNMVPMGAYSDQEECEGEDLTPEKISDSNATLTWLICRLGIRENGEPANMAPILRRSWHMKCEFLLTRIIEALDGSRVQALCETFQMQSPPT